MERKQICNYRFAARRFCNTNRNANYLIEDMQSLLRSGTFSDITLQCGSESFRVHKNILSARSPVFASMFLNPMQDSHQNFVNIQGIEPFILRIILEYIYCSRTGPLNASLACELLSAAEAYQLPGLKIMCVDFLRYVMCDENVFHIAKIASLYDENLRADACKFICKKYETFEQKQEWKAFQAEHPHIVIDIMALKISLLKCGEFNYPSNKEMMPIKELKRKISDHFS